MSNILLSVVISAYNEEAKIKDCLESVNWADEIILIDNSSTDKTVEIAKKYTSKIFTRPNNPMLNVNKNYGFSKASGNWILSLDADERVTPQLREEIGNLSRLTLDSAAAGKFEIGNSNVVGYWIPRKNIIFGKWMQHTGWYPDYQLRLFKKEIGKFPEEHVHEMVHVEGETEHLHEPLLHYNFETIDQFLRKHLTIYSTNEAEQIIKNGYSFHYLDAIRFPLKEFLSRFFAREGYKDGLHGLIISMLMGFYHFVIFIKIWEKQGFKEHESPQFFSEIEKEAQRAGREFSYWFTTEKLKHTKSSLKRFGLKLQRKLK